MKNWVLFFLGFLFILSCVKKPKVYSEELFEISGVVYSESKNAMPFVDVFLYSKFDTLISKTNFDGEFKFEKLIIWQKAMEFAEEIHSIASSFPQMELYSLSSQIRRASDSIALNISEGSIGQSAPEFKRFMGFSIRSLAEVVTCLHKAKRREYIKGTEFEKYYDESFHLMNMMISFRNKLK